MPLTPMFQSVILQPTTLCNLNCGYCYLSESSRKARRGMSVHVARAIAASIREQEAPTPVDVVWHGGEPLALRREQFAELCDVFEPLRRSGAVRHYVQTNATLINDAWCRFFQRYGFNVGVSLDGPESANTDRVDWSGRESFSRVMKGVNALKRNGIGFSAICVVTPETIHDPDRLFEFFEGLGPESVGFNIEETEGANSSRNIVSLEDARHFWRALFSRIDSGSPLRSREAGRLFGYLADVKSGNKARWSDVLHEPIPTVSWDGDVVVLSPELLGVESDEYGDFLIGNVLRESLPVMLTRAPNVPYVSEFFQGVENCRTSCEFFDFCRGGQAGNKFFELGNFTGTETRYCQTGKQQLVLALTEYMEVTP